MLNEFEEYKAYTGKVSYEAKNKYDSTYLGRFTYDMLLKDIGLSRVLTIIARGYLWNGAEADFERARKALCAWCSIPDAKNAQPKKAGQSETDFRILNSEFPELVDKTGAGWYVRHVRKIINFSKKHPEKLMKSALTSCEALKKGFTSHWRNKLMQFQVPLFSEFTKGAWTLRFDDILADALEAGPLRNNEQQLSDELILELKELTPKGVPDNVLPVLTQYYISNRQGGTDWVVLPVTNFDAYFGTSAFSRKWLPAMPKKILERSVSSYGVSRYRMFLD